MSQLRFKVGDKILIAHEGVNRYSPASIISIGAKGKRAKTPSTPNALPKLVPVNGDTRKEDLRYHVHYDGWDSWYDEVVETHRVLKRPGVDMNLGSMMANLDASSNSPHDDLDDGESCSDQEVQEQIHSHDKALVGNDHGMDVSKNEPMEQDDDDEEVKDASSSSSGSATISWIGEEVSGEQDVHQEVVDHLRTTALSDDDDEVVILSTIGFDLVLRDFNNESGSK